VTHQSTVGTNNPLLIQDASEMARELFEMVSTLFPICRSITGDGVRKSLRQLQRWVPLTLQEVPTGTKVFDWVVPNEWNIDDAYVKNDLSQRVIDFRKSNLHVVNYSVPVRKKLPLSELREHLFALPEKPDWIPYRTSYYKETWGFCLSQRQLDSLEDAEYEVCIESSLKPGSLTYGEFIVPGKQKKEVLISCHCCHPSLCNDNLSGMVVAAKLAQLISTRAPRYTYRFLWSPGTIGAIAWLALHEEILPHIKHGLVLSCVGDSGPFTYKRSRGGVAEIDRAVEHALQFSGAAFNLVDFTPLGYDERQYCSPGIDLPVGSFMRTPNGKYPQYHTSADDLNLVSGASLAESLDALLSVVDVLEKNGRYLNLSPKCEPQLGRRGLYRLVGGTNSSRFEEAVLWVLNWSDGKHSLLEIAEKAKLPFSTIVEATKGLETCNLLRRLPDERA
jgi:aminopeptidase-like protein